MTDPVPPQDCHTEDDPPQGHRSSNGVIDPFRKARSAAEPAGEGTGSDPDKSDTGKIDKGFGS